MNTASWGPDGWKLLHSIAYCYTYKKNENENHNDKNIKRFFMSIKHLLPCIYCRRSYSKYMKELPIDDYLKNKNNKKNLFYHLYLIHNKVNKKLQEQGYNDKPDPSYRYVTSLYRSFVKKINCLVGWHFLYCSIFEYPGKKCSKRRRNGYITFFNLLADFLPCRRIRKKYQAYLLLHPIEDYMSSRKKLGNWLHGLEQKIRGERCKPYKVRCDMVEECRVKKCKGQTCRKELV